MDDRSYQEALQRRERLLQQLKDVEEFIRLYQRLFQEQTGTPPVSTDQTQSVAQTEAPKRRQRNILSPARLGEIAREEILKARRPLTRSELVDALEARGIPLAGVDKAKNIGTILWRLDTFLNIPGRGYWPSDEPLDGHLL